MMTIKTNLPIWEKYLRLVLLKDEKTTIEHIFGVIYMSHKKQNVVQWLRGMYNKKSFILSAWKSY